MISKDIFKKGMTRLENAFQKNPSQETLKIYYEKLSNEIIDKDFSEIVEKIIDADHFFPSIARFKEILKERQKAPVWW